MLRTLGWFIILGFLAGCRTASPPPYHDYAVTPPPVTLESNAFAAYLEAAKDVRELVPDELDKVNFSAGKEIAITSKLNPVLAKIKSAQTNAARFPFKPPPPFQPAENRAEWRMIGRAISWEIATSVKEERFRDATLWTLVGTRFGLDLTGGDSIDASLGFVIVDEVRKALLPGLQRLESSELETLKNGLNRLLENRPATEAIIENDRIGARMFVQELQEAYRKQDFKLFEDNLGLDIGPAIKHMQQLRHDDASRRPEYFRGLVEEIDGAAKFATEQSRMSAKARVEAKPPKLDEDRPWRRWVKFFVVPPQPVFLARDRTLARTRLLALHCGVMAAIRKSKAAPADLKTFPQDLNLDPFTNRPFVFHATGIDYRLYSCGFDQRDDGGETDGAFEAPDLKLETHEF